jgi:D-alanyl-D-alanine carboxypeptidase (penicillin-binding protein 5/6)
MKWIKKLTAVLSAAVLTATVCAQTVFGAVTYEPDSFAVSAQGAYLINTDTDTLIYAKNEEEQLPPASLTKIMTAILVLEKYRGADESSTEQNLSDVVVTAPGYVFDELFTLNASTADIRRGEEVRMIDLLYALLLASACEAGSIIADYMGDGDIQAFVDQMNEKAKEIGCKNTHFTDPHGLDDNQYTTAYDMYLITKYALSLPMFEKISTTVSYEMPATNKHESTRYVIHTNNMLSQVRGGSLYYKPVKGIKTGTTGLDTKNLVSIAEKDGYHYLAVVLGCPVYDAQGNKVSNSYMDTKNLYEWAFDDFEIRKILDTEYRAVEAPVKLAKDKDYVIAVPKEDISLLMPSNIDVSTIQKIPELKEDLKAPLKAGEDIVGTLTLKLKDEVLATVDLVAAENIEQSKVLFVLDEVKHFFSLIYVKIGLAVLLVAILVYIGFTISLYRKKKRGRYRMRRK